MRRDEQGKGTQPMSWDIITQIVDALQQEVFLVEQKTPDIHSDGRTVYTVKIILHPETLQSSWAEYLRFQLDDQAQNHLTFLNTGHRVLRWNMDSLLREIYKWIQDRVEQRLRLESEERVSAVDQHSSRYNTSS